MELPRRLCALAKCQEMFKLNEVCRSHVNKFDSIADLKVACYDHASCAHPYAPIQSIIFSLVPTASVNIIST
jgi:hypothetical protein